MRIPYDIMLKQFEKNLIDAGFSQMATNEIARVFAENSLEGIPSHGLNRFADFIKMSKQGIVKKDALPTLENKIGALEVWDGQMGPGIINAQKSMDRALHLADEHGIGCVAIRNTNHWMRGGTYGWQAAEQGCISISFSNTTALMVPWGGVEATLGNNPLVIAVPNENGHIVLDMALSQYSMGMVKNYVGKGSELEMDGGYDEKGNISKDPKIIMTSRKLLPIGFWKGTGLSLMLDLIASLLSKGRSTSEISKDAIESGVSQVFICIKADSNSIDYSQISDRILDFTKSSSPLGNVRFPGENIKKIRASNLENGIPVDNKIWTELISMK